MGAYSKALQAPGVLAVTASQLFARLPLGLLSLAILLHLQALSGAWAVGGAVVACVSIGQAVAMPVTAWLAARVGRTSTLAITALLNGTGMTLLAFARPHPVILMLLGVVVGASVPPLMPVVRALYPRMAPRSEVRALFALDATAQELIWVIGPPVAAVLASSWSTSAPLLISAVITIVGTAWFLVSARHWHPPAAAATSAFGRVLANRALLLAVFASLTLIASFTALEVGIVAGYGHSGMTAGGLIAIASLGSLLGGLLIGHRKLRLGGLVTALAVVAAGTGLYGAVDNVALQFAALFVSGLGFAPSLSALYHMVSQAVAENAATEAFGWLSSGGFVGAAAGTAISGVATDLHGVTGAVIVATALAVLAACCPLLARISGPLAGLERSAGCR